MRSFDARLSALESGHAGMREPLLIILRAVAPGCLDVHPRGTRPAPPHLPAVDRLPGEGWEDFRARLGAMVAHLPAGTVVTVATCDDAKP